MNLILKLFFYSLFIFQFNVKTTYIEGVYYFMVKEKNLESNRPLVLAIMFLIDFFIFILFIHNFNIFIYTYIAIFNIFSLINLIFAKKSSKFIDLYSAISMSSFSLFLFLFGLYKLNEILYTSNFIKISILFIATYILIIILSINHIKNFYSSKAYQNKTLKNSTKYGLIFFGSLLGLFISKLNLNQDFIISLGMILLGCGFAVCYSHFYKFSLNKTK